jgi:hypothetical protein
MGDERRDDWRHDVDESLVALNAAQRVTDRLLEDLDANYAALDRLLRGDPEKDTDGVIAKIHLLETQLARLNAVIFMDSTGKKGLQHEVEILSSGERTQGERWKFATAVIVAIITSAALVITNWDHIAAYFNQKDTDPVDVAIEKSKHPRGGKIFVRKIHRTEEEGD